MDWSLALASQGIEAVIDHLPEDSGWQLLVPRPDYEKAVETLRQYELENRGWPWRQPLAGTDLRFDWRSIVWVGLLVLFFWLDTRFALRGAGAMDGDLFKHGQWWRLFTAIWLHADAGHLASNATLGLVLIGLVMSRYGSMLGLLMACLTGAGGNFLEALVTAQSYRSIGASGVVMGCLGLLAVPSLGLRRMLKEHAGTNKARQPAQIIRTALRYVMTAVFAGVMLFVLVALGPGTDVRAHLGGFLCGLTIAGLLAGSSALEQKPNLQLFCGIVFCAQVIVPWWFALHHQ